jgi:group I intron endonuclease
MANCDVGVYQVRCKVNSWIYIGGSERSRLNRWSCHRAQLRTGVHYSKKLQEDWSKYGEKKFVFEVLEDCSKKKVRDREQYYLDLHFGKKCYNVQPNARSGLGSKRDPANHDARSAKASARCTKEWRAAVSARVIKQHAEGNFGASTWTEESRHLLSESLSKALKGHPGWTKGQKRTPEQCARYKAAAQLREQSRRDGTLAPYTGERHWAYGTTWSAETRITIAATKAATKAAKHEEHLSDYFAGPRASRQSLESFLTKGPKCTHSKQAA